MLKEALEQSGVAGLIGWTDSNNDEDNVLGKALEAALYPFQLLITPTAIKAYLTTILFLTTSFILLSISTTAFGLFYYSYIPQTDLERPIHLQYGVDTYPRAEVSLNTNTLISQQPYDVSIVLHMPRDPVNLAAGNFMLDLTLRGKPENIAASVLETLNLEEQRPSTALHRSRRPAIMPYASTTTGLISKLVHLPLHILSFHDSDSVTLNIPMFEEVVFARGKDNVPSTAEIEIQSQRPPALAMAKEACAAPQLHIYSAKLVFQVRFHGLRYLIYNHRMLAFAAFTTLFYTVSISTLAVVWAVIATLLSTPGDQQLVKQEPKIKQEGDTSDPLRTSDYKSDKTQKQITDNSENETVNFRENWTSPHMQQEEFTPQTSQPASSASQDQAVVAGAEPEEQADDEEEESEDELQQYARLRKRMEDEARQRQRAQDSGIGTSMESDNAGRSGLVKRSNSRRGSGRE
ncbi:hypothetical protein PMZ80_007451 [Knufia obscura]|uniref:Seipin n=1 Tax=Knufia obscura TaxID=1635080 RepID=A0ABR0RHD2_9EURO|nr:hypothetical protein PMZ80_007451 [Knufia obscura]